MTELVEVEDLLNMCSVFSMQVIFFFCHLVYVNFSLFRLVFNISI